MDEPKGTESELRSNLSVVGSEWCKNILSRTIGFLQVFAQVSGSETALREAEGLKVIRDGYAIPMRSCPTCEGVEARYPVVCDQCAPAVGAVSPQKYVIRTAVVGSPLDGEVADDYIWMAAFFGIAFVMQAIGRPNTHAAAEALLDELQTEADVLKLQQLCDMKTHTNEKPDLLPN